MEYKGYSMCNGKDCTIQKDCYRFILYNEIKPIGNYYYVMPDYNKETNECHVKIIRNNKLEK